jgi:HPr kinase/phosphorylase
MLINDISLYLNKLLAPSLTVHGVLVDVYGVGILLTGHSGIGKSETALELVKRGHRLVADDNVIIKQISDDLIGTSPEMIRYFMEIRGIGIINVRNMYGTGSILNEKEIELIIEMESWEICFIMTLSSATSLCPLLTSSKAVSLFPMPLCPVSSIPTP